MATNNDNDDVKWLYGKLKAKGYDIGSEQDFSNSLANEDDRKWYYEKAKGMGLDMGSMDDFNNLYAPKTASQPTTTTATEQPASTTPAPVTETEQPTEQTWKPTEREKAKMLRDMERMRQGIAQTTADFNEHMDAMKEYGFGMGQTVKGKRKFNPQTGKLEQTYITPAGNRYTNKAMADMESFQYRQAAANMTVGGQLRRARQELEDLKAERERRAEEVHKKWEEQTKKNTAPLGFVLAADTYVPMQMSDKEKRAYEVAIRQKEEQIKMLEDQQDRDNGVDVGFWRGFGRTMGDVRTWDFGMGDMLDAMTMMNAGDLTGENATEGEKKAHDAMMGAVYENQETQKAYGDNASFWNRAGVMTGYMPSFMLDFALTSGGFGGIKAAGTQAVKLSTKAIGKEALEEIAKQGVRAYVKKEGVKGAGRVAADWTIKALGTTADDLLIRAPLMTNTVQLGKTTADIIDRKLGDVTVDENGNYDFSNDKTWGSAIWQGEANAIVENYSEMFGAHLDPVMSLGNMSKLANVLGAKRLGNVLAKADAGALSGIMGDTQKLFNKMGVSDYTGEVAEEYYGQLWRTMLNLDDAYQENPDGTRTNLFATGQFHGDIWGGMALSMGLMGAGKYTLNAAGYVSMKHGVNKADKAASALLGEDVWEPLRATLDLTTNENFGDVADLIVNDKDFTNEQKAAVLSYMERSMYMRGYNLATMANARGGEQDADTQLLNEAFIDGYNASSPQELNDAKNQYDLQRQRMKDIVGTNEEALDSDVVDWLNEARNAKAAGDENRAQVILDYLNAKQVRDGMIQRVRDDIDGQIAQSDAMIDARTHCSSGMIETAILKAQGENGEDRTVYVVDGNLVTLADGSGIDHDQSDESIVVRDAQTGELEMVSPDAILKTDTPIDPNVEKQTAADAIRAQVAQQAANHMDGVLAFNPGDTYTINDGGGDTQVTVVGNAVDENGAPIDGQVIVQFADGTQTTFAKQDLQTMAEASNLARLNDFEQQRAQENLARQQAEHEATRPQYALNDMVTLRDENGNTVRGSITADENEDGLYEVYTEDPINGKRVNLFTRDDLDAMLVEHNGQAIAEPETSEPAMTEEPTTTTEQTDGELPPPPTDMTFDSDGNPIKIEQPQPTASERIPKDEQGNPLYEQAETPDLAWDAIVEESEGDADIASEVVTDIVNEKAAAAEKAQKALKKAMEAKPEQPKGGAAPSMQERIAAKKAAKETIANAQAEADRAKEELSVWQKIAQTPQRRKNAEEAERRRIADEKAAAQKAEQERFRAEQEEAERIKREALNGVPDMSEDTPQDARARGYRRVSGHKVDRQEPVQHLQGKEVAVKFSDDTTAKGRVAVMEASELQPSHIQGQRNPAHFIDEAQPKERNDEASVMSARKIAGNMRPEEITTSVTAYTGAPTVNARGEVIQGNNRSAALRLMWESEKGQAAAYKQYLKDHAEEFGLNADEIEAMQNPVLVNMLDVTDDEAISLGQYVAQDTESGGTERIKPKNAVQKMGKEMRTFAKLLLKSADDETSFAGLVDRNGEEVLRWMNQRGYITPTQYSSAFDSKGALTAEAKNDLKSIMYQSIFQGGNTRLEEMFNAMPAKAQKAILATAFRDYDSPQSERMVEEIQNSIMAYNALSQDATFASAKNWKEARMAVESWKRQYYMDDVTGESYLPADKFSNFALHLATMYKGESQGLIQETFNRLYDLIQGTQEENLFEKPDNTPRTLAQAIYETLNIQYDGQQRSNVLAGDSTAGQQGRQGSGGNAASGERTEDGNGTADRAGGTESSSGPVEIDENTEETALSSRVEVLDDNWEEGDEKAPTYKRSIVIDGKYTVVQVDEPNKDGDYTGSYFEYDGKRFGDLPEAVEYIDRTPSLAERVEAAESQTNTTPTDAQKEAGNYKKGHVQVGTFNVTIENPKGSVRSGVDANGRKWETMMQNTYGYILGTEGVDGDHIDVFLSDDMDGWNGRRVFVVDQYNEDGTFDEHKVMMGFNSEEEAMDAYLSNYEKGWADSHTPVLTSVNIEEFEKWIASSHRKTKPFAEYKGVKKESGQSVEQSADKVEGTKSGYTIEPAQYTTKRGKVLDMQLVKFDMELDDTVRKHTTMLAKQLKGWWDREKQGFMMRSKEDAERLADYATDLQSQPRISLTDLQQVSDGNVQFTEPVRTEAPQPLMSEQGATNDEEIVKAAQGKTFVSPKNGDTLKVVYTPNGKVFVNIKSNGKENSHEVSAAEAANALTSGNWVEQKEQAPVWQYSISVDKETGLTTLTRDDVSGVIPIGDGRFHYTANSPEEMLELVRNPQNFGQEVRDAVETTLENRVKTRKLDRELKEEAAKQEPKPENNPSGNHLVTDERYAELRERMRKKLLGQMNIGIDPEILAIGTEMAVYHLEKGARKFAEYAKVMIADLGDAIRPYLKAFYNGARDLPEVSENGLSADMTSYEDVQKFDVANFDKPGIDALATAETVTREAEVEQEVEVAQERIKKVRSKRNQNEKKTVNLQQSNELELFDEQFNEPKTEEDGLQGIHEPRPEGLPADSNRNSGRGSRKADNEEVRQAGRGTEQRAAQGNGRAGEELPESDRRSAGRLQGLEAPAERKNTRNNHSERGADHAPTSVDARIEANIKAIELSRQLIENGEQATPEQMEILRKFSGWGGLGKAFNDRAYSARLQELLGAEAYQEAVMSANSAYYTPAYVVDTLWDIAQQVGFKGGSILEGSAGIGNILGQMPTAVSERSDIHAVEIDRTSGGILSLLYPDAKVEIQGFEQTRIPNGSVDLAITNVPFVTGLRVNDTTGDKDLSKKFHNIHDFCIAKNVRKLREGGIGIFITSNGTLDNSKQLRDWIVNEGGADFIGAFRMNNKTFGGTGVTSDIVVIRKRVNGQKSAQTIDVSTIAGERSADYDTGETRKVKGQEIPVVKHLAMDYNRYFIEHPENMAGVMQFAFEQGDTFRPTSKGLYPAKGKNQEQMLAEFVSRFTEESTDPVTIEQSVKTGDRYVTDASANGKKLGELYVKDGKLVVAGAGGYYPLAVNDNKVKGHTKAECFTAYTAIKEALAGVLSYQTENESDEGLKPLLQKLNKAYDSFVNTYGHFNKNTAIAFLRNDVDYANVSSVETYKEKGDGKGGIKQTFGKADVMNGRVVEKEKEPTPDNVKDGIIASVFKFGRIDIPYIAGQIGKTADEVKTEIIKGGYGFENPVTQQMEPAYQYKSGNVREKLRQAQENNENGAYDRNIKALQEVMPMDIPAHLIDFTLGSSWIAPELYNEYVKDRTDIEVSFTSAGGTWFMDAPDYGLGKEKNRAMGIYSEQFRKTIFGHTLIEAAIQNKTITVSQTYKKWDGTTETVTDKEATQACAAKIEEIRQDFKDWARQKMQSDSEMSETMERIYNDTFNNYVPMSIPDEFVPKYFGGASHKFTMRPHQGRAIVRGTMQPLLLAHEVGSGKTFTLISTAMEMRRLGTARKPMIVVQNATVGQFVASAKELYPNAKILTLEEADRSAEGRKNFYAKIRYNDWDMIVVPQSTFEFIPDSEERQMQFVQDKIEEKMLVLEQMKDADPRGNSMITRQAKKEIADLEAQLAALSDEAATKRSAADEKKRAVTLQNAEVQAREMLDRRTDDVENFDDMGIDALLIDEAHEYKHLGFATAMQRGVKGVDPSYSKKSQGVYLKTQAVLEKNNGRNVIFATGTPISNTAAEIWTFMRYLMPVDTMKEYGIYYFDDFVRNFGNIQQMLEFATNGKFKENNRFAGYVNLPELVRIWSGVSDTVRFQEIEEDRRKQGKDDLRPEIEGGKATDIYLPQTRALRGIMKFVKAQLQAYDEMSGKEKKENSHIPLTMYGIAKAAAVDARLVSADAEDDPNSKTNEAVHQTLRSLKETDSYKGTVAIFADNYQNKQSGFNLYEDIRSKLIAAGVPADEVVVIKSGMSVKKKLEVFEKMNRGEVRVLLGSTFTLGTGVNIQERLHTLIHVDAPNRPMDYTQRNGRIHRQGNIHKDMGIPVRILRFGVEDSLDVTAYQRLKTKGAIADSIMNGKEMMNNSMTNRVLEEEEDVFGDTVAQLSGSEYAMLKNNAEKNVRKYESRKKQWEADQTYIHNAKPRLKGQIAEAEHRVETNRNFLSKVKEAFPDGTFAEITAGKQTFPGIDAMADLFKEHNKKVLEKMKQMKEGGESNHVRELTVSLGGFVFKMRTELSKEMTSGDGQLFSEVHRKMTYSCPELGLEDVPVKQGLLRNAIEDITKNVITGKDYSERIEAAERSAEHGLSELKQLEQREGKPFEFAKELDEVKKQYAEYSELMKKELEEKEAKYAEMDKEVEADSSVTNAEEVEDEDTLYRISEEMKETNERFNEELQQQIDGTLPKGHVYELGEPSEVLLSAGLPNLPIEMAASRLSDKSMQENHPFELSEVMDLPQAIQNPMAVFRSATHIGSYVVMTEIEHNGKNFVVAIEANRNRGRIEVNSIRSVHYRTSNAHIANWVSEGLLEYADKEKMAEWFSKQRYNSADVRKLFNHAAKLVESFENPSVNGENLREGDGMLTDDELSYENDPVAKILGKSRRTKAQRKAFAERERQRMAELVQELAERLHLDNVEIVTDSSTLEGNKAKAKGFFNKRTGKITVVIPNQTSVYDAEQTLLHESVAHYGLRQLFGEHFDTFLDNVFQNADEEIRRKIVELAKKHGWDFRTATEEYLAGLAERTDFENTNASWWQKIKSLFLDMLHKIGFEGFSGVTLTDNELRYILWRSYENLAEPGRYRSILGEAADVAKQYELKVGNYTESQQRQSAVAEEGEELYRDGDPEIHERALARDRYEQRVKSGAYQSQEALQDSMLGLKEAMQAILGKKTHMEDVDGFENAYLGENRLSSVNLAEMDAFANTLFKPMLDEVARLAHSEAEREELTDYMMAKHGLERNRVMAERDAQKAFDENQKSHPNSTKTLQDFINEYRERDYAGLTALTGMDEVADAEAEAQSMVDDYENSHDTTELWNKVNAVSKAILSKSYECGMMSKETYESIAAMYDFYIPLRGFDETTSSEAYAYLTQRQSAFNAPIKKAEGRKSKADDPFANLQSMAEGAIMQGNRNKLVKQKFLNFVLNHPSDLVSVSDLWLQHDAVTDEWKPVFPDNIDINDTPDIVEKKMQDFEERMKQLAENDPDSYKRGKDAANIPYRVVESRDLRQHQVVVKRNGRDYLITINGNPRAAQALNGQTNPDNDMSGAIGAILGMGEKLNRQLSAFYTTRNPDFVVSNFVRDLLYTNSMAWIKESPNYALRFHRNYIKVNPVMMKRLLAKHRKVTLDMNDPLEAMFHQFMMNGGETGYANIRDIEQHKNDIRRELKKANGKLKASRAWELLGERLDEYNRAVENCARFAAFMTSREMGRTIDRAIYDAKEISVNFNKKGSGAKFLGSVGQTKIGNVSAFTSGIGRSGYVFWNAAIQGTTNFGRQMKRHPAKAFTGAAALFLLGALIAGISGSGDDDDDDKNAYYNLPEYVRRSNILFSIGDSWISLPLPVEYRAFYGMGELMTSVLSGKEHFTGGEIAEAVAGQVTQILPIDFLEGGGGLNAFVPSSAKPLWEAYVAEKSWTGMPLYKDSPYNKDMPEWTKVYSSANKYIVGLANVMNEATGGDRYTKGAVDINPAKVEYLLNGYFGGVFSTIDKMTKTAETLAGNREYDPRSILLVNRLVKAGDERTEYRAINNEYFRLKEEHDRIKGRLRNYENDTDNGIFDYAEKIDFLYNSPEYERFEIFEDYKPDIDALYDELKEAGESGDSEEVKDIERELNDVKKEMIDEMNQTRKRK